MRVLIVEDEPYLAEAVRDGLRLEAIDGQGLQEQAANGPSTSPATTVLWA